MQSLHSTVYVIVTYYVGVTHLTNTTYKPDLIVVTWDPVSSPYCREVLYYQAVISSDEHDDIPNDAINITCSAATFLDLRGNTTYNITVTTANRAGHAFITVNTATEMITESCSIKHSHVRGIGM